MSCQHDRSPELFHEMLLAGDQYLPLVELLERHRKGVAAFYPQLATAAEKDALESVLVLKTEDMTPDRVIESGFLQNLATFVGVDQAGFNTTTYESLFICGSNRGINSHCTKSSSAYEIAGGHPMLPESRGLVYLLFAEECKYWKEHFGLIYEDCLAVREKYI